MKAVIFDMDGVIIDSEPIHFYVDKLVLSKIVGMEVTGEYLEKYVGMTNPEMWKAIIQEYRLQQTVDELIEHQLSSKLKILNETPIQPISGILELLQNLSDNHIPLGIASSSPRRFIEGVLTKFDIRKLFNTVVSGEEVENGKPAPDVYIEAARILGIPPEKCTVIEDSRNGVLASKRAGMRCIGYQNLNSGNQDLSSSDHIVGSITEITIEMLIGTLK
ncbi:HAD family hydrolase [Paenibacillus rhizovicinus]|uniref:HAD family hydrolase n=1 Tax=Paenibacillus rhizovicinus TaxID=2704463 RepID=A0A6C0P649_9BACL|nr:HAD family hydrolase [Paenibacillus rhizovicinus]QHW33796.1 HAD family hydrolase [Paenibacillus rhizovicinus]